MISAVASNLPAGMHTVEVYRQTEGGQGETQLLALTVADGALVDPPAGPGLLSPFDLPGPMVMDTSRAAALGYRFDHSDDWLDLTIRQHDLAFV